MTKMQIALDCDGLLSNFVSGVLVVVEEVTGKKFDSADVTESDFSRALGLSAWETSEVKKAIGARRGFAMALPPYPQARQGVRRLRELGEVFCVTTPWKSNPWWRAERESWLALHFGIDRVCYADSGDKSGYEADVFVDDASTCVQAWLTTWPGRTAVFWRTSHNTGEAVPWGAHSVGSWEALYQVVLEAARGLPPTPLSVAEEVAP